MGRGLVGDHVGNDAQGHQPRQNFSGIADQGD